MPKEGDVVKSAVVMLTCNRKDYTKKTIENFERQLGSSGCISDFDFFICDNGSTDGTAEYLKSYAGKLNLDVTYNAENVGIAVATKYLLSEKCFDKGYDFIIKVDDDEYIPDNWENLLNYWDEAEKNNAVFLGFRRNDQNDYFEGFAWISKSQLNDEKIILGDYECYLARLSPGIQISKEHWWKRIFDDMSDIGGLYGGWDHSLFCVLKNKLRKSFLVVWNQETIHLQNPDDHKEFSEMKTHEMNKYKRKLELLEKIEQMRRKSVELNVDFPDKKEIIDSVSNLFKD